MIELREDGVVRLALAPGVAERGVILETLGAAIARDEAGIREAAHGDGPARATRSWPGSRAASGARASTSTCRPASAWSARSSSAGRPASAQRALLTRTLIRLGAGAEASLVEELAPSGPAIACAAGEPVPQSLFGGTSEIDLGAGAVLRFASIQDLPAGTTALQQRTARIGAGASLRFAIAQLGRAGRPLADRQPAGG